MNLKAKPLSYIESVLSQTDDIVLNTCTYICHQD